MPLLPLCSLRREHDAVSLEQISRIVQRPQGDEWLFCLEMPPVLVYQTDLNLLVIEYL